MGLPAKKLSYPSYELHDLSEVEQSFISQGVLESSFFAQEINEDFKNNTSINVFDNPIEIPPRVFKEKLPASTIASILTEVRSTALIRNLDVLSFSTVNFQGEEVSLRKIYAFLSTSSVPEYKIFAKKLALQAYEYSDQKFQTGGLTFNEVQELKTMFELYISSFDDLEFINKMRDNIIEIMLSSRKRLKESMQESFESSQELYKFVLSLTQVLASDGVKYNFADGIDYEEQEYPTRFEWLNPETGEKFLGEKALTREEIHQKIIEHYLSKAKTVPEGVSPKMFCSGGMPASGKTTALREVLKGYGGEYGAVFCSVDDFLEWFPEIQQNPASIKDARVVQSLYQECNWLNWYIKDQAIFQRKNLVFDSGMGFDGFIKYIMQAAMAVNEHGNQLRGGEGCDLEFEVGFVSCLSHEAFRRNMLVRGRSVEIDTFLRSLEGFINIEKLTEIMQENADILIPIRELAIIDNTSSQPNGEADLAVIRKLRKADNGEIIDETEETEFVREKIKEFALAVKMARELVEARNKAQ